MASKFHIERVSHRNHEELRLHGVFDGTSAWELRHEVAALPGGRPLVVDFSGVTQLFDFGAATLAAGYGRKRWPPVQFTGVAAHHAAVLRQYGLELETPLPVAGLAAALVGEPAA